MTMLEVADGERGSYLDIADVIETRSTRVRDDLRQLWRRMAFSVLIRNTDDHLRNHGFLRASTAGWALSPAFDLNPDPSPGDKHLSTAIDYNATEARIDLVVDVAGFFRLDALQARTILADVFDAVARWRAAAHDANVAAAEIDRMARAFEHRETERARALVAAA
jgi:serine/threonine-protein kinase HipA